MLLGGLPRTSRLSEALANDDDYVATVLALPDSPKATGPSVTEFDHTAALLTSIGEVLVGINATLVQLGDGKPPTQRPWPRPVTAFDRAEDRRRRVAFDSIVAEVEAAQDRYQKNHSRR